MRKIKQLNVVNMQKQYFNEKKHCVAVNVDLHLFRNIKFIFIQQTKLLSELGK